MKFFSNLIFISFVAYVFSTVDIDELYAYLPLLEKITPPPSCPMNEMYAICKSPCSDCVNRKRCIFNFCDKGCDCLSHFYRLTPDGPCVPVANCPIPECGENEVFRACGPIWEACTATKCQAINCEYKCYCKSGFLRNKDGKCIPQDECPKRERCFRHEKWAESGPADEFCLKGENGTKTDEIKNVTQCYCKDGFKRNTLGHCVNEAHCNQHCIGVEIYHDCIPNCNTTCRNYGNPNCTEDDNCYPGCFCPPGYLMNDFRYCIPIGNCSLDVEQLKLTDDRDDVEESSGNDTSSTQDSTESTTETYTEVTNEIVPSTTPDFEPTEATSCGTVQSSEEIKDSSDKSMIDDNNTAK